MTAHKVECTVSPRMNYYRDFSTAPPAASLATLERQSTTELPPRLW